MGPVSYIDSTDLSASPASVQGRPFPLHLDNVQGVSFHFEVSNGASSPAGTFVVEATNDPAVLKDIPRGTDTATWTDVSSLLTIPSHTADGDYMINFSFANYAAVRVRATRTTGTFTIRGWVSSIDLG